MNYFRRLSANVQDQGEQEHYEKSHVNQAVYNLETEYNENTIYALS